MADCGAPVQFLHDEVADRLWIVAYYIEVFGKIETFDKGINHKRTDRKSEEGIESGRNVKHKAAGNGDHHIGDQKCMSDIYTGIFLQDHCNDICTSAGRADVE